MRFLCGRLEQSQAVMLLFFSSNEKETTIYEKVNEDLDGDVYITPKGKKYHAPGCYILRKSEEFKQASRSSAIEVGYTPCRKCKP